MKEAATSITEANPSSLEEILEKIRHIRKLENPTLKPSPYLKESYVDDSGVERPVQIRNYQKIGILNLLMLPNIILGDDTGLGKTLMVLSAIGYIWMKEPEYVPIILTKKSSIFQWAAETKKFMESMEAVVIDGEPYERHSLYENFFLKHDPSKKKLCLLTYDMIFRDTSQSVIRDKSQKPDPKLKKKLLALKERLKELKLNLETSKEVLLKRFNDLDDNSKSAAKNLFDMPGNPDVNGNSILSPDDIKLIRDTKQLKIDFLSTEEEIKSVKDLIAPPKLTQGLISYMQSLKKSHPSAKFVLVMDEMHVLKNHKSKFHEKVSEISTLCDRTIGMTATPIKNKLMEFFSLFRIIRPRLMPKISKFYEDFCVTKMQRISGGRQIPIVVGYKNLDRFVSVIEPYYLSRRKFEVAKELPQLVTRELVCELSEAQEELYDLAEADLLGSSDSGDSPLDGDNTSSMLKALTHVQQAVDSPALLADEEGNPFQGVSCKEEAVLDLLENELDGIKTIIFSKFERMISILEKSINSKGIKTVRITGKETNASVREKAKQIFQDMKSGVNVILITMAGSESINLHSAEHTIYVDSPWSWGDYVQLTGRNSRIGSQYLMIVATHLLAVRRSGAKTIDHHVIQALKTKKSLSDKVSGETVKDGLQFMPEREATDLFNMVRSGCKDRETLLEQFNQKMASSKSKLRSSSKKPTKAKSPIQEDSAVFALDIDFSDI